VVDENSLLTGITLDYVRMHMPQANLDRAGWYYQQLLKILALAILPAEEDDILLIWDADTLPMRKLTFSDAEGRLLYFTGAEHHQPYFDTINRLLGYGKKIDFSFVAQCLPVRKGWIRAFVDFVQARHGEGLVDAILANANLSLISGFSEYETLGAFIANTHLSDMALQTLPWERYGYSHFGSLEAVYDSELLGREFAYIAFEHWDRVAPRPGERVALMPVPTAQQIFTKIYEEGVWGSVEGDKYHSGGGSHDPAVVLPYLVAVEKFLGSFPNKPNIVDLGCGDFAIGARVRPLCGKYIACDIVEPLIDYNKERFRDLGVDFRVLNVASDPCPVTEVIFIRQVLQHLSNGEILACLPNIIAASKYMVVSEHVPKKDGFVANLPKPTGPGIRLTLGSGLVLTEAPFNLRPVEEIHLCDSAADDGIIRTTAYRFF
jgi:hypothetical protein